MDLIMDSEVASTTRLLTRDEAALLIHQRFLLARQIEEWRALLDCQQNGLLSSLYIWRQLINTSNRLPMSRRGPLDCIKDYIQMKRELAMWNMVLDMRRKFHRKQKETLMEKHWHQMNQLKEKHRRDLQTAGEQEEPSEDFVNPVKPLVSNI